jgi:hypothetical protein
MTKSSIMRTVGELVRGTKSHSDAPSHLLLAPFEIGISKGSS